MPKSMKIDTGTIKHVAKIARLDLTDKEVEEFTPQLAEILKAFSQIQKVDTKSVRPSYHSVELKDVLREDKPKKCLDNKTALKNSKNIKDGYFKGPKVV